MPYKHYMVRKRCRVEGIDGPVNLRYGTLVNCENGIIMYEGKRVCLAQSENGLRYFSHNDDGMAALRGAYVESILTALKLKDGVENAREQRDAIWEYVWADKTCLKYKNPNFDDFFLWDKSFYEACIEDLRYINELVGGKFHEQY